MLSEYHQKYAAYSDAEIMSRVQVKDIGLRQVMASIGAQVPVAPEVRVMVLGCADKRFIEQLKRIFSSIFGKPVRLTTSDVTTEHLAGAEGVIQHDATMPLPGGPYDVIYGDVLVRFIEPAKQFAALKNSYDALAPGGIAIHIFAQEDFDPPEGYQPMSGTHKVDLNALQLEMTKAGIFFLEVPLRYDVLKPGSDTEKMLIDEQAIVLRKS
ncbi:MAG: class I SAM-dependent methyltransferase [Patescibacteria group bacterium]